MPTTPNKGYEVQVTGSNSGTWGDVLNDDVISIQDDNIGGIVTKNVAGSGITLSPTESQMLIVRLTGAQSADIQLTTSCIGMFFVENLTTNAFAITVVNDQIATSVVVPKGRCTVISDATNGCRIAGTDGFPPGTRMSFQQTAAPTGWTKDVANDNKALRVVSGSVSSGGTLGFTTCFNATRSLTGSVASYTLQIADIPSHNHPVTLDNGGSSFVVNNGSGSSLGISPGGSQHVSGASTSNTGGGGAHTHASGTLNAQMDVAYIDMIIAVKN